MPESGRKSLAFAQSRDPKSIRYAPAEWKLFVEAAVLRGVEPSALARDCSVMGLTVLETPVLMEAYCRALSVLRQDSGVLRPSHAEAKPA